MTRKLISAGVIIIIAVFLATSCTANDKIPIGTQGVSSIVPGGTETAGNPNTPAAVTTLPGVTVTTGLTTSAGIASQTPNTSRPTASTVRTTQLTTKQTPGSVRNTAQSQYVVFAWNDLGMHCANPTYDSAVLLPPYNTVWAQIVKRGTTPQIVTSGVNVEYRIINNTSSYDKGAYNGFWDNMKKIFGVSLDKNKGLNLSDPKVNNSLSGQMAAKSDHFEAVGIPVTPIDDANNWNPYQVAEITVKDASGKVIAQTEAMVPISDEINCAKCHGDNAFQDILQKHDKLSNTNLVNQQPVLCASCHGDPALGIPDAGQNRYLSDVMHTYHSTINPQPACYDCHPGNKTQCSRSIAHTTTGGNCTTCHGGLSNVGTSIKNGRTPWANEPACSTCHQGIAQVDTGKTLYRNAIGHGNMYCASCHSSPHAMVPSNQAADNYQAIQYTGAAKTIGDCGACHNSSRGAGGNVGEFNEEHGGTNPQMLNACHVCHTNISSNTASWPHQFQWKNRQGVGSAQGGSRRGN